MNWVLLDDPSLMLPPAVTRLRPLCHRMLCMLIAIRDTPAQGRKRLLTAWSPPNHGLLLTTRPARLTGLR